MEADFEVQQAPTGNLTAEDSALLTVRAVAGIEEYRACQEVQRRAFHLADESYVVPVATMVGAQLHGGLVLGAFLPEAGAERLIGFSFAFPGRSEGRLCLYSQITAVDPSIHSSGVGAALKQAQREWARGQGLAFIAWAFDPLQSRNAYFNLAKLGATVARYVEDMYGPRTDRLSRGVPSDRLIVEWPTDPAPGPPPPSTGLPQVIHARSGDDGLLRVEGVDTDRDEPMLFLEVPWDIVAVKEADLEAGWAWHGAVRRAFQAYLGRGYRGVGFVRRQEHGLTRCSYVLERRTAG